MGWCWVPRKSFTYLPRESTGLGMSTLTDKNPLPPEWNPSAKGEPLSGGGLDNDEVSDVHIPAAGISVFDEMDRAQKDRFVSDVVPVRGLPGVAQIISSPMVTYSFEPLRYLVAISPPTLKYEADPDDTQLSEVEPTLVNSTFVMVDVPPFSPQLAARMRSFMGLNYTVAAILVTSRDAIHYDEAQAIFSNRRSDLRWWTQVFPEAQVVAYRLDVPRDCRRFISQILDGYGPFAAHKNEGNFTFVESGRPLTRNEWDYNTAQEVLSGGSLPPDDEDATTDPIQDEEKYTPEAIRSREEGKSVLAVYTPGYSFGSVSYVFPETGVCCSGFTLPVEDTRVAENEGFVDTGPALDARGYVTTSRGGIKRQMESARNLVTTYCDRFNAILPSRGAPLVLDGSVGERKGYLLNIIKQYQQIGEIYDQLGITSGDRDDAL